MNDIFAATDYSKYKTEELRLKLEYIKNSYKEAKRSKKKAALAAQLSDEFRRINRELFLRENKIEG